MEVHLWNAGLALSRCRQPQQEVGQRRSADAVIQRVLRGVAVGELVVAAILEEAPHGPDELLVSAAELGAVASNLPTERIAPLNLGVPGLHRRRKVVVAKGRITLDC